MARAFCRVRKLDRLKEIEGARAGGCNLVMEPERSQEASWSCPHTLGEHFPITAMKFVERAVK